MRKKQKNKRKYLAGGFLASFFLGAVFVLGLVNGVWGDDAVSSSGDVANLNNQESDMADASALIEEIKQDVDEQQNELPEIEIVDLPDINDEMPEVKVEVSDDDGTDDSKIDLSTTVESVADKVEYYMDDGSVNNVYLGTAKEDDNDEKSTEEKMNELKKKVDSKIKNGEVEKKEWKLTIDQEKRIPNGEVEIYAKIKDKNTEYESKRVKVRIEKKYEEQKKKLAETFGELPPDLDYDGDEVSNEEEIRLGTDPYSADTDNDGYIDGDEIKNGFDPLKASKGNKSDKVVLETPKKSGQVKESYKVKSVEMKREGEENQLVFSGKALPNSFVRLYIYSDNPIIVTVRTDSDGNWTYELDKELENGEHEVYVAVTDNTGKITSKSKPLMFVKTAEAVTVTPTIDAEASKSPTNQLSSVSLLYGLLIIVATFSIALLLIKVLSVKK